MTVVCVVTQLITMYSRSARRGAADCGEYRQAAGAAEPALLTDLQFLRCIVGKLVPATVEQSAAPGTDRSPRDARGLSLTFHLIDPQMSRTCALNAPDRRRKSPSCRSPDH